MKMIVCKTQKEYDMQDIARVKQTITLEGFKHTLNKALRNPSEAIGRDRDLQIRLNRGLDVVVGFLAELNKLQPDLVTVSLSESDMKTLNNLNKELADAS